MIDWTNKMTVAVVAYVTSFLVLASNRGVTVKYLAARHSLIVQFQIPCWFPPREKPCALWFDALFPTQGLPSSLLWEKNVCCGGDDDFNAGKGWHLRMGATHFPSMGFMNHAKSVTYPLDKRYLQTSPTHPSIYIYRKERNSNPPRNCGYLLSLPCYLHLARRHRWKPMDTESDRGSSGRVDRPGQGDGCWDGTWTKHGDEDPLFPEEHLSFTEGSTFDFFLYMTNCIYRSRSICLSSMTIYGYTYICMKDTYPFTQTSIA